jgi:hypothetical protein
MKDLAISQLSSRTYQSALIYMNILIEEAGGKYCTSKMYVKFMKIPL